MARVPEITRGRISLVRGIHCCPNSFYFFCPNSAPLYCEYCEKYVVYIHIPDCVHTVYELPLLPNNTAGEIFLYKSRTVRSVERILITGAPALGRKCECVTLGKKLFKIYFSNRK